MSDDPVKIRAYPGNWFAGVNILIRNSKLKAKTIKFEPIPEAESIPPTLILDAQQAQTLMDDLWNCGLRPTEGTGSAGALKATQNHLEDMRRLVFDNFQHEYSSGERPTIILKEGK